MVWSTPLGRVRFRGVVAIPLILLAGMACAGTPAPTGAPGPATSTPAGPATPATTEADAWRAKGATEVPPESVRQVAIGAIGVVNQTSGAVSDADARGWALALLRSSGYDDWALNRMQDGFLLRGGLSSAPQAVFAGELGYIQKARTAGARVEATSQTIRRLVLRPLPDSLRQFFASQAMTWSQYGFYVDKIGPSEIATVDGSGARTVVARLGAGVGVPELFAGQLVHDAVLGDFWRLDSDFACGSAQSRQQLGGACDP